MYKIHVGEKKGCSDKTKYIKVYFVEIIKESVIELNGALTNDKTKRICFLTVKRIRKIRNNLRITQRRKY